MWLKLDGQVRLRFHASSMDGNRKGKSCPANRLIWRAGGDEGQREATTDR